MKGFRRDGECKKFAPSGLLYHDGDRLSQRCAAYRPAYEAIATDVLARFQKLDGKDVFFLTGTDEHGQKMIQTAQREGISALELATRNAALLRKLDEKLNVSFSRFIRTSEERASSFGPGSLAAHG